MKGNTSKVGIYFSDFFSIDPKVIEGYGAFNVSLVNDLPLFIDPFLLFDSENDKYRELHDEIIRYLRFLRDQSTSRLDKVSVDQLFYFKEVKQNWLGFSKEGNGGNGLGAKFARDLHSNLHSVFREFGSEAITKSSHLEKVCLFSTGVGRDHLSDFTTNLIKQYLLEYTQSFATEHLREDQRKRVAITKVSFDYQAKRWKSGHYILPYMRGDFVLLTPRDMLTRDAAWINRQDLLDGIEDIFESIPDAQLRAQINGYFLSKLADDPTDKEFREAASGTVNKYPVLIDHYIKLKEESAEDAHKQSSAKVRSTEKLFIQQVGSFVSSHLVGTDFYKLGRSYEESLARVSFLKNVIENKDGWRLFYIDNVPIKKEVNLQLLYRLTWFATPLDVNREPNNGRGPVDYAISSGSKDKTLVEFKLAKNSKLKSNLESQVATYEVANETDSSITVILYFDEIEYFRVMKILKELDMTTDKNIILIDASPKTSASLL